MKESLWGTAIVVAGVIGIGIILLFQNLTSTDQQNYYLLREVTEAAMYDSIDVAYFRINGDYRIIEEKFVENFLRRWSESADRSRTYQIEFKDIVEMPPKVSIVIRLCAVQGCEQNEGEGFNYTREQFDVVNSIDMILETKY